MRQLFDQRVLSSDLLLVLRHIRDGDPNYDPSNWWGEGYRALFKNKTGSACHDFVPTKLRQLLRSPGDVLEHSLRYVAFHCAQCESLSAAGKTRNIVDDIEAFTRVLSPNEIDEDAAIELLFEADYKDSLKPIPRWLLFFFIHDQFNDFLANAWAGELAELREKARIELSPPPVGLADDVLNIFGISAPSPSQLVSQESEVRRVQEEVEWAKAAMEQLETLLFCWKGMLP